MKRTSIVLTLLVCLRLLAACGSGTSTPPPPLAASLKMTSASTAAAGTALQVTVTAVGTNGGVASTYTGTVHFTSSDSQAILPADSTLSGGSKTFSVTLKTAGNQYIGVTDTTTASITGSNSIGVNAGPASSFTVSGPPAATTGFVINISLTVQDAYGNVATGYTGTLKFSSSDAQAILPANSTLSGGTGSFSVTFKTIGSQTVSAADTVTASLKASTSPINVVSNAPTHLSFNGLPGSATTRKPLNFTVNALDAANNVAVGYAGTVHFSSSDAQAMLPANATLTAGVSGSVTATFETAGSPSQTITATDTASSALTGAATVSVGSAAVLNVTSGTPPGGTVGASYDPHVVTVCLPGPGPTGCVTAQVQVHGFSLIPGGGISPYTWSWAAASGSSVPEGLGVVNVGTPYANYDCGGLLGAHVFGFPPCITGNPTQPGTFNVVVTVTDSGKPSAQSSAPYSITINKPAAPHVAGVPPSGVENQPYSFAFSASGYPPLTWSESGTLPPGITFNGSNETLSGTPTQTGSFPIIITATDQFGQSSQPANFTLVVYAHGFVAAGNMTAARALHTSTLLNGGKVLITGGTNFGNPPTVMASAEIYDPTAGTFAATANMQTARADHTATLLNDGRVLIAGGCSITLTDPLASAELFDATGATSTATGSMNTARCGHTATLLPSGKVLLVGGFDSTSTSLASAELFDPTTNTFSSTGNLQTARKQHTATLLASGKVLVTGGIDAKSNDLDSAELYDPTAGTFTTVVGTMTAARAGHTATLFTAGTDAGKVLLAGGVDATGQAQNTAELFDPVAQSFTATNNMIATHAFYTATLLQDGTVLLAGGPTSVAELFDPSSGNFSATGSLVQAFEQHAATLLPNGQVLVTGGSNGTSIASAELYK